MKPILAAVILLAWPPAAAASQVTLSASTQTATIAERIELRVVVRADARVQGIRVEVPPGPYEVIARRSLPAARTREGGTFEEIVTIAFFKTGDFTVGPLRVDLLSRRAVSSSEQTGQLAVRIRSLLGENDKDIKPLKEPLPIRGSMRHLLPYAAAFLLLLLLMTGALLLKKRKKPDLAQAAPPLPPEIELEMRARDLREKNLPQAGEFRRFFILLSEMLKLFVQRAYGFNAEDCTSEETVARLQDSEPDGEILAQLRAMFGQADLVKFARLVPEKDAVAGIWPMIASLVRKHKQRREPPPASTHVQASR